jgi:hypothetical protein
MANEFIIKNGFRSRGNSQITGSLSATSFIGDGSGLNSVPVTLPTGTVSSSAQIASDISGSFVAPSASFSSRVAANEVVTAKTLVSSSAQIATEISGAFAAPSASFSTRVTSNTTNIGTLTAATASYLTSLPSGILSGSAQIASDISGSFASPSASFSSRVTTNETNITTLTANTGSYAVTDEFAQFSSVQAAQLTATSRVNADAFRVVVDDEFTFIGGGINVGGDVTSSADILATGTVLGSNLSGTNTGDQDLSPYALTTAISGSFVAPSASFSSRTTALEDKTIYSGSFSGSFQGNGSGLTDISVFPFNGNAQITGSLKVSGSIDYEIPDSQFKSFKVPGYYRKAFANNAGDAVQYVDDYIEIHFNDAGTDDIEMTIMKDPAAGEVHVTINNEGAYTYLDRKNADGRFDLNASLGADEFNQIDVRAPSDITWPWYRITFINANATSGNFVTMLIEKFI